MQKRLHAIVSGSVQGVGYRYFVLYWAEQLHLSGFVQNIPDDAVEVVAEGSTEKLKELLEKLKQGPSSAIVKNVSVQWLEATREFSSFEIVHSFL